MKMLGRREPRQRGPRAPRFAIVPTPTFLPSAGVAHDRNVPLHMLVRFFLSRYADWNGIKSRDLTGAHDCADGLYPLDC